MFKENKYKSGIASRTPQKFKAKTYGPFANESGDHLYYVPDYFEIPNEYLEAFGISCKNFGQKIL